MRNVIERLRSLSRYCDELSRDLLDRRMGQRLSEAARYFGDQADALQVGIGQDNPGFAAHAFPVPKAR